MTACFIGVFIPDEKYEPTIEEMTAPGIADMMPEIFGDQDKHHHSFWNDVQEAHDNAVSSIRWGADNHNPEWEGEELDTWRTDVHGSLVALEAEWS